MVLISNGEVHFRFLSFIVLCNFSLASELFTLLIFFLAMLQGLYMFYVESLMFFIYSVLRQCVFKKYDLIIFLSFVVTDNLNFINKATHLALSESTMFQIYN